MTMQHSHTGTYLTEVALGQAGWQAAETVGTGSMWSVELHEGDFQVQQQHIGHRAAAYRAADCKAMAGPHSAVAERLYSSTLWQGRAVGTSDSLVLLFGTASDSLVLRALYCGEDGMFSTTLEYMQPGCMLDSRNFRGA